MVGQTKTLNNIFNVLKYVLSGISLLTAFIPGLQPVAALAGITAGTMGIANGVNNLIHSADSVNKGKMNTMDKVSNISEIVGGALGVVSPFVSAINPIISGAMTGVQGVNTAIGASATGTNFINNYGPKFMRY
jgi:hypothetical protein